ncbi:DUF339-domain-containing protein [Daldinia caldariorum]|uniref:DUF339-domain-containing protein n=1 Tax=Daldinia caldariorum TaxID=326644 RepID=UPI002007BDC1|nr:DUF339-domain-containing protein [Daldinia caldariorum]KAI1467814.1 DUF339-domain-containing protein [Daldinia caldariorum]
MASVAAILPRAIMRSAQQPPVAAAARLFVVRRPLSSSAAARARFPHNQQHFEPHKPRSSDIDVGALEGSNFRVEPMRRTGEDDDTLRARIVYQSRKRGTLESDLLLSTFTDEYLPTMTRAQMEQYDLFLDENDWDIYYWATQEPPSDSTTPSAAASNIPSIATEDTSSADYAGGVEAAISEATPLDIGCSNGSARTTTGVSEPLTTGGAPLSGDSSQGKEPGPEPPRRAQSAETGEWAQTVGTFKPAYRPVPARWRDSEILQLLREHVKARSKERGGMAFMPALR